MKVTRTHVLAALALAALAPLTQLAFGQAAAPVDGEVKKIDKAQSKITLSHNEIKNLDMPAMTMAFRVKEPAMLDRVQVGDRVKFTAERVSGQYTVTSLQKAP